VQEVNRIYNLCKSRDYDSLLQSVFDLLEAGKNARAAEVKNLCADVLNTWIRAVENERNDFSIAFYSKLFDMLDRCVTVDELRQAFRDVHAQMFRAFEPCDRRRQFAEILHYIHAHYAEDLSIERFAQQMNMSVGHFSRTFKEEIGEKYVEYIAKVRIDKAKQYLLETDLNIDEIAAKVGYWGRNSFIPIFRKYEGVTPAKYRSLYKSEQSGLTRPGSSVSFAKYHTLHNSTT
jgi:YesN/AraC family two-component response regulator